DIHADPTCAGDRRARSRNLDGPPRNFGFAAPTGRSIDRRIVGGTVQRQPGIAPKIMELARVRHHPEIDLTILKLPPDSPAPRRAILAQRRPRCVLADCKTFRGGNGPSAIPSP